MVRESQVDQAVKSLTAFVSSRMSRPPGIVEASDSFQSPRRQADSDPPYEPSNADLNEMAKSSNPSETALQQKIKVLEAQLVAKDAQRDIIIDTKLKRIQDLVLRLHATNTRLRTELHDAVQQNEKLHDFIKKEPKLQSKFNKINLQPFSEQDALDRATYATVPSKPYGHN
jgi:cell fate (sporulation/competence/biofilm development) regulator YlbF (YheA/YmcA/DUF963 family)